MLTINKSTALIKNLNLRLEMLGEDTKPACDIKLIIHIIEGAEELLQGLSIGQLSLWDKEGDAQLSELAMRCRHAIEEARVTLRGRTEGSVVHAQTSINLDKAKIDKVSLNALDGKGVEITCTIKTTVNNSQVVKLLDLWIGGNVTIEAKELGQVEIAA